MPMIDNRRPPCDVLDATMFWSPQSGGVGRYLRAKHEWLSAQPGWAHTIATPLADAYSTLRIPSLPLPFSGGYRVPVARAAAAQCLAGAEPDLIEAGDPYRLAWAALDAAERRGVPAVAFCHSNLELLARSLAGEQAAIWARRYTNRLYRRFALVLAPSRVLAARLAQVFSAQNAWRRAVSIGWNRLLASAQARHPLVRLELHPADVQHAAVRRTWVAILRQPCADARRADRRMAVDHAIGRGGGDARSRLTPWRGGIGPSRHAACCSKAATSAEESPWMLSC